MFCPFSGSIALCCSCSPFHHSSQHSPHNLYSPWCPETSQPSYLPQVTLNRWSVHIIKGIYSTSHLSFQDRALRFPHTLDTAVSSFQSYMFRTELRWHLLPAVLNCTTSPDFLLVHTVKKSWWDEAVIHELTFQVCSNTVCGGVNICVSQVSPFSERVSHV